VRSGPPRNTGQGDDVELGMGGGGGLSQLLNIRTFRSFKNPVFRLYFGALLGQMAAMNMQMFARLWLMKELTDSPAIVGATAFAHAVPMLCLSLFGGVIADRMQKKYVMLIGQAGSALAVLGVAIALSLGYLSPEVEGSFWILVGASVLQGTIMGLMMPSRQAILPEIVGEEQLMNALSLNNLGSNVLRIMAPAACGFLIKELDYAAVYYIMSGMYIVAIVFIALLPRTSTITVGGIGALEGIKEGLKYLRGQTTIILVLLLTLGAVVLSMPYMYLLPFLCEDVLHVDEAGGGMLLSVSGIGAITASLIIASLPNKRRGLMLLVSCLVLGMALTAFSISQSWYLSLGLMVFIGIGTTGRMTLGNTLIQYYVDDEYRGRVMSIYMMEFGLTSFGTFAAGVMGETWGVQWAIGGFAVGLVLISLVTLTFARRIRRLD
jgi:MFS family permease